MRGLRRLIALDDSDFGIVNKKEINNMATAVSYGFSREKTGAFEYKMPQAMADAFLKARKGDDKKMQPMDYLVKVVNDEFDLLYKCVRVITY